MMKKLSIRIAAMMLAVFCVVGSVTPTVLAHNGHGNSSCKNSSSSYCAYHHTKHKSKCSKYCAYHKTTHSNGKKHKANCTNNGVCTNKANCTTKANCTNNGVCKNNCK